jgi:crossover junction endodeoxyribonuclease RuvC
MIPAYRTIGIDPGKTGAIAILSTDTNGVGRLFIWDMPINEITGDPCPFELHAILKNSTNFNALAYLELVGARPNQGVVSTFNFGVGFGIVQAALAINQIPITMVRPSDWKPRMRIPSGGTKTQKKAKAMDRAGQLLPFCTDMWPLKKHDGRAEAALIAVYGHLSENRPMKSIQEGTVNGR